MTEEVDELRKSLLSSSKDGNKFLGYVESKKSLAIKNQEVTKLIDLAVRLIYEEKSIEITSNDSECLTTGSQTNILNTNYDQTTLSDCLTKLHRNSKEAIHSYGSSILYLTIGFLEMDEKVRAPLSLIPVQLKKSTSGKFSLQWTGEDPFTSLALQKDVMNNLPNFPIINMDNLDSYKDKLKIYFENAEDAILNNNWKIHYDIVLDLFSNKKYQMYVDLDPVNWGDKMQKHPVLQELYSIKSGIEPQVYEDEAELNETYRVFADDLSHIAAIESVKSGKSLLIDGGPGTGKSQTIVGMITELLGQKKKVLFVSDKQPAIDVVFRRLDKELGLGNFCLVLHSDKLKKNAIYDDINFSWSKAEEIKESGEPEYGELLISFYNNKKILDDYAISLSEIRCQRHLTVYDLVGLDAKSNRHFKNVGRKMVDIYFENPEDWTSDEWTKATFALEELMNYSDTCTSEDVWNGCEPGSVGQQDVSKIGKQIIECIDLHESLQDDIARTCRLCSLNVPLTVSDIEKKTIPGMKLILESQAFEDIRIPNAKVVLKNGNWDQIQENVVQSLKNLNGMKTEILRYFDESIFDMSLDGIGKFADATDLEKSLDPSYSAFIIEVRGHCVDAKKNLSDHILESKFNLLLECEKIKKELEEEENLVSYLGSYWKGEESDIFQIEKFVNWAELFQKAYKEDEIFTNNVFDIIGCNQSASAKASQSNPFVKLNATDFQDLTRKYNQRVDNLFVSLGTNSITLFENNVDSVQFSYLKERLDLWNENILSLASREKITACKTRCSVTVAKDIIPFVDSGDVFLEDVISTFEGNYSKKMLNDIIKEPILESITSNMYNKARNDFIEIENEILKLNTSKLAYELATNIEASSKKMAGMGSPENLLRSKKQSIDNLMENAGNLVKSIKPCFMMSPTSVVQYLPQDICFDVVIFDEASQLKNVDAMGSILRAEQLVVCGDMNQMPPSNYFETMAENTDYVFDENIVSLTNVESILGMASTKMENRTLDWHYRSKHESLIAVPNEMIYDNRFYVHPSPKSDSKDLGLDFIHYEEGVYLTGIRTNPLEAKKIVEDVFDYHSKHPNKTIGIAAFSIPQMDAIQNEIDILLRDNPDASNFFSSPEKFFVKNLENIQGDERDAIFLSICYGYNQEGKFSQNFSQLNKNGGEKKLNVFITRAKEKCSIYANFNPDEIKIAETTSAGVRLLKAFMKYADTRDFKTINKENLAKTSDLGECICGILKENGYTTRTNYGVGKYYIDIVVEDPVKEGHFLAAILLDGPQFYNTKNTRDRVRTHHEVLKNMGWNLFYVLSPEWHLEGEKKENELINYLDDLKKKSEEEYSNDLQNQNLMI